MTVNSVDLAEVCSRLMDISLQLQYNLYMVLLSAGIFVMTVNSVDLAEVCSRLMDISLQLLASVKSLERSLAQVQ
jgi:PIN domain nuclease of toxin-antitoxin system